MKVTWNQLWDMLSTWDNDDLYMNKVKKLFQRLQIECLNQHINDVEGFIKSFDIIADSLNEYIEVTNVITIDIPELIEKVLVPERERWEAELLVTTPKQRRDKK